MSSSLTTRPRLLAALTWSAAVAALIFALFHAHGFDDPFTTYRYSENLARGLGFVYNPGERVLSTTTPLYTLLLVVPRLLGLDLPLTSMAISSAALAAGGLLLFLLGCQLHTPLAGLVAMLLYPLTPLLLPTLGAETALYCTLILGSFLAYARNRPLTTALLLALATLTRADGILAAGVIGLAAFLQIFQNGHEDTKTQSSHIFPNLRAFAPSWKKDRATSLPNLRAFASSWLTGLALYTAIVAAWHLFAWAYFGSPLPATLAAKQRQGSMLISDSFAQGLLDLAQAYWAQPLLQLQLLAALAGLIYALGWRRGWLPLVAWGVIYAAAYSALGVTRYFWYYGPLAPVLFALLGLAIQALVALIRSRPLAWAGAIAGTALLAWPLLAALPGQVARIDSRLAIYQAAGAWLRANTPAEATVGTLEVGVIGFYAQRPIVDFAGLIQPDIAQEIGPASDYGDLTAWAFTRYQPDFLVLRAPAPPQLAALPDFQQHCAERHQLTNSGYEGTLIIYACSGL
ncbi:MAG: hypothetical protein H7Z42_04875 [Roseiflexaceae bacterium]|nr:hypothetical protein [Roseiflexaceae bacterium]